MDIELTRLGAPQPGGVTFGIPWARGTRSRGDSHTSPALKAADGTIFPTQTRALAYWPDGSVKWTLHSAVLPSDNSFILSDDQPAAVLQDAPCVRVVQSSDSISVDTGAVTCTIDLRTSPLIRSIVRSSDGKALCSGVRLVAISEQRFPQGDNKTIYQREKFHGKAYHAVVEEYGPVRAVVRLRGSHVGETSALRTTSRERKWLTFDLRLYFYAGQPQIRMVHTFIFDGREEEDFICGLGLEFDVPLRGAAINRHVRIAGEDGLFSESPKSLWVRQNAAGYLDAYRAQLDGRSNFIDAQTMLNDMTEWDAFRITQHSSARYDIAKRCGDAFTWVRADTGGRSLGALYAGGSEGGLAVFRKDFWQKFPSALEAVGMLSDTGTVRAWFHSPTAPAMDMRRYDNRTHVEACYEGFEEMRSSAYGIGNTNELTVWACDAFPGNVELIDWAKSCQRPNLLLADAAYYPSTGVLGAVWSPVDRSTPNRAFVEDALDALLIYYKEERELRDWYGFWDYGDIRHTYDPERHNWRYDFGGYGWQNTELVPNLWLWYAFLRSGRQGAGRSPAPFGAAGQSPASEDYFEWAEAMTRHTSEVDLYHLGDYKGLGSRHNVIHWGCGCKEGRIGMSALHKVYYYLTGDGRVGDIMDDQRDSDKAIARVDPLRAYYTPEPDGRCHMRLGPDLMAIASNWLTRWERFEDTRYRDRLLKMLSQIMKPGIMVARTVWLYDPDTVDMTLCDVDPVEHFNYCFGADYVWPEIYTTLADETLKARYADMGLIFSPGVNAADMLRAWDIPLGMFANQRKPFVPLMMSGPVAQAAAISGDSALAKLTWETLLSIDTPIPERAFPVPVRRTYVSLPHVSRKLTEAPPQVTGNESGQWGSHIITALACISDSLDEMIIES
ncbi:MAG: hypothetical protein LBS72_05450 [Oscillospiraceae bacterium]|jgi:hypothetical protein|nr:hypothetical protein [Oscillospiraceae bacterium]